MIIRPFVEADYPAFVAARNAAFPEHPVALEEMRHRDASRSARIRHARFVAEADGRVVGAGGYGQNEFGYHPRKFTLSLHVLPEWRRRGVGTALYETLTEAIAPFDPMTYKAATIETQADGMAFLARRGFVETLREWESRLKVADFDPARFPDEGDRLAAQGLRLATLAALRAQDPDADRKLYVLDDITGADIPSDDAHVQPPFETWQAMLLKNPGFRPEAFFIAVAPDGSYAGVSMLFHPLAGEHLNTGLTGVHPAWRRKGVARALKLRAIAYAKALGVPEIRTENASTNAGMLAINEALGFVRHPAWVSFEKPVE